MKPQKVGIHFLTYIDIKFKLKKKYSKQQENKYNWW